MLDVSANYGTLIDFIEFLGIFINYYGPFMSDVLYLDQTFTDCVSNHYRHM